LHKYSQEVIKEYLRTAGEKLESARILFEHSRFDDAVSRAYYAVFHSAQALLLSIGVRSDSHSGTRHLFGLHFIKSGKFDKRFARYLKKLKDDRENGDYGIFTFIERKEADAALKEAREFFKETKKYLKM